jgi:mannose/cellobiose epimerase-like protein (N-acyl-D-glucosamine 2-epimerase family)
MRCLRRTDGAFAAAAIPEEHGELSDLIDFYDQAFVLFGLAWWYRSMGNPSALATAQGLLQAMDRHLRDRANGGWREANEARPVR